MSVLILGGTGVISRCIAERLIEGGKEPVLFNRGSRKLPFSRDLETIVGDKQDVQQFRRLMTGRRFDAVIDMISFNAEDARQTVETFRGSTGQLIVCSSSAAYKRPFRNIPVREDEEELCDSPAFPYAYHKAELERYLQTVIAEGSLPVTIIRPSLTFGVGGANLGVLRQNSNIVHRIRQGKPLVMFGDGTLPWSFSFAPDVARAFAGAVGNPAAYGKAYHATSEELHMWEDLYTEFGRLLGIEPNIVHISTDLLRQANPALFDHLYFEKSYPGVFDNAKIRRDIPPFRTEMSLSAGLAMMLDWYEREGMPFDADKDALEDRLAELHGRWSGELKAMFQ